MAKVFVRPEISMEILICSSRTTAKSNSVLMERKVQEIQGVKKKGYSVV